MRKGLRMKFMCALFFVSCSLYSFEWNPSGRPPASPSDVTRTGGGYNLLQQYVQDIEGLKRELAKAQHELHASREELSFKDAAIRDLARRVVLLEHMPKTDSIIPTDVELGGSSASVATSLCEEQKVLLERNELDMLLQKIEDIEHVLQPTHPLQLKTYTEQETQTAHSLADHNAPTESVQSEDRSVQTDVIFEYKKNNRDVLLLVGIGVGAALVAGISYGLYKKIMSSKKSEEPIEEPVLQAETTRQLPLPCISPSLVQELAAPQHEQSLQAAFSKHKVTIALVAALAGVGIVYAVSQAQKKSAA